jgi:hypothetical protein
MVQGFTGAGLSTADTSADVVGSVLVVGLAALAVATAALLTWMAVQVGRRGGVDPRVSAWLRGLAPLVLGPGGWFLGALIASSLWPAGLSGVTLAVVAVGATVGSGIYLAWVHKGRTLWILVGGLVLALGGAGLGAWLGRALVDGLTGALAAVVGAAIGANLALVIHDGVTLRLASPTPRRAARSRL